MRKSKFSEHQIIAILKAVEAGRTVDGNWGKLMEFYKNYPEPVQTDTFAK